MKLRRCLAMLLAFALLLGTVPALAEYNMPYYIYVDLTNQIVTIYNTSDHSIARQMLCSAGVGDKTPVGEYIMPAKDRKDERSEWYWMPNAYTWVKYPTKIYYAYFFHSIPYNDNRDDAISQTALEQFGNAASHGCIRLLLDDAYFIATECLKGTYVKIYRSGVKDENLRALLYDQGTYIQGEGKTYAEFLGIAQGDLGRGCSGNDVMDLQHRLSDLGYYEGEADGMYGDGTIAAVMQLQKDMGILASGICTGELLDVIYSDEAPVQTGKTTVSEGQSGPVVEKLQLALQELGIYQGNVDTIYDADVVEAVATFQRFCGITEDGVASPETQFAIYYVLDQLHTRLGSAFTAERVTEDVVYGTIDAKANIIMRQEKDTDSHRVGKVNIGDRVMVLNVDDKWAQIVSDGTVGYIYKKYLDNQENEQLFTMKYTSASGESLTLGISAQDMAAGGSSELLQKISAAYSAGETMDYLHDAAVQLATVNTGSDDVRLNLRASASADSAVLDKAANGSSMRVLENDGEWTKAVYNGQIVYLMSSYLTYYEGSQEDVAACEESQRSGSGKAVVSADGEKMGAKIYVASSEEASVFTRAEDQLEVEVLSLNEETGWALIRCGDNCGYIQTSKLVLQ